MEKSHQSLHVRAVSNVEANRHVWLPAIAARIAGFLPPNIVACTLRLVDNATSQQFSDMRTVQLSQPAPRAAFAAHWLAPKACRNFTLKQRQQLVCLVAASGDVANLEIAIQVAGCSPPRQALEAAAGAGTLECCQHLAGVLQLSADGWDRPLHAAAKGGHRAVCEWSRAQGAERSWGAVAAAYSGGHTELAELLKLGAEEPDTYEKTRVLSGVAEGCSFEMLRCTWAEWSEQLLQGEVLEGEALSAAVCSPTPDWEAKAEFLLAQGLSFDLEYCAQDVLRLPPATALQRLEWMRGRGGAPGEQSLSQAIEAGSLEGVRWMLDAGASCRCMPHAGELCAVAPLEVVQLLVTRNLIGPARVVKSALAAGSRGLPALCWLVDTYGAGLLNPRAEGLNFFSSWSFGTAAEGGCVETMAFLLQHGAAYDVTFSKHSWKFAAQSGCEAALDWLDQRGCPDPDDGQPYAWAAGNNDLRTLRVLRRLGLPWAESSSASGAFATAVGKGAALPTLRWMVAERCPVDWAAAREAAEERLQGLHDPADPSAAEVLAWIEEQEAQGDEQEGEAQEDEEAEEEQENEDQEDEDGAAA